MNADTPLVGMVSPSPNFGDRQGKRIDALILHYTGMRTGALAHARLLDPASQVSCHYLVWEDGRIEQLVAEAARAWHAGRSFWAGESDMNSVSIGIEIVNGGHEGGCPPYPKIQIDAVVALAGDICARHRIAPDRVLGHSDIAPARKRDPGEWFPWDRLVKAGIARGTRARKSEAQRIDEPSMSGAAIERVQRALCGIGFDCPTTGTVDRTTSELIKAFQRRHRPARIDGGIDDETRALIEALS